METTNALELTERLTNSGFTVESFTSEDGFTEEADRHVHLDIRKDTNASLKCHVEIDTEGAIVEAFIEILDENGKSYTNRDMTMFIEDADCEDIDSLLKRLEHVFA